MSTDRARPISGQRRRDTGAHLGRFGPDRVEQRAPVAASGVHPVDDLDHHRQRLGPHVVEIGKLAKQFQPCKVGGAEHRAGVAVAPGPRPRPR